MATMIPGDIEEFGTEGEKAFYKFLEGVAKPDVHYLCWYTPDINGNEPDFLLYCEDVGLIIFEVKDWALRQIEEANPHQFLLRIRDKTESRKNPLQQAHDYLNSIKDKIQKDGHLISTDPAFHGNPKIPLSCGVVFPHINKYEYTGKGLEKVIGVEKIFFWDDLDSRSDICCDPCGQCFLKALKEKFPPRFSFKISLKEQNLLKELIFPAVKIELPRKPKEDICGEGIDRLKVLDNHQEAIARKYDGGHRILVGPSGSGKTLILVHKAALLKNYNPKVKNILFVCYNITLVNYIKRLLSDKKVPLGENGVEVLHFFELCSKILVQDIAYEKEESDYYKLIVSEALSKIPGSGLKYDAILVDEGQDFSDDMYKVVTSLLNEKTNNLTIALDEGQNIYNSRQSWKDLGIQAKGRLHRVSYVYRCTKELHEFSSRFIGTNGGPPESNAAQQHGMFPDLYEYHGPKPQIRQFQSIGEIIDFVSGKIKKLVDEGECSCSDVAILYTMRSTQGSPETHIPHVVGKALEKRGILHNWVSEDYRSKRSYDVTTDTVTISTIQSAKGFDYSRVFLIGLDLFDPAKGSDARLNSLTYVAITRARYELFIPYVKKSNLIGKLLGCL
jgi:Nuclease-related domain/UvrD-like helicase C-terminal domain/AAA domain